MKTWVKLVLGLGAAALAVGGAVTVMVKRHGEEVDECAEVEEETYGDSDSDCENE